MVAAATPRSSPRRGSALLPVLLATALVCIAPSPAAALTALTQTSTDPTGPLLAAVGLCAWVCAAWLLLCTALTAAGRVLPGLSGRTAAALGTHCAPRAVRRVAELAVGMTVATAALTGTGAWADDGLPTGSAVAPATLPSSASSAAPTLAAPINLDWPVGPATAAASPAPTARGSAAATGAGVVAGAGAEARAGVGVRSGAGAAPSPTASPLSLSPSPRPAPMATSPMASVSPPVRRAASVVIVQPGDCLWDLARASLGPATSDRQVAAAWPSWWSANRVLIGGDPDLLQPGMHLVPPTT